MKELWNKKNYFIFVIAFLFCLLGTRAMTVQAVEIGTSGGQTVINHIMTDTQDSYLHVGDELSVNAEVLDEYISETSGLSRDKLTITWLVKPYNPNNKYPEEAVEVGKDGKFRVIQSMLGCTVKVKFDFGNDHVVYSYGREVKPEKAKNLVWDGNVAKWDPVSYADKYDLYLYQNGHKIASLPNITTSSFDLGQYLLQNGTGSYTFGINACANVEWYEKGSSSLESVRSVENKYTVPQITKLATPSVRYHDGMVEWDAVEGASFYQIWTVVNGRAEEYWDNRYTSCSFDISYEVWKYGEENVDVAVQAVYTENPDSYNSNIATLKGDSFAKLPNPTGLRWDGYTAVWDAVPGADGYEIQVCDTEGFLYIPVGVDGNTTKLDCYDFIKNSGKPKYYFSVQALNTKKPAGSSRVIKSTGTVEWKGDSNSGSSGPWGKFSGLTWDGYVARWNPVENVACYKCELYKNGEWRTESRIYNDKCYVDWTDYIEDEPGTYYFVVYAGDSDADLSYSHYCAESDKIELDGKLYGISVSGGMATDIEGKLLMWVGEGMKITLTATLTEGYWKFDKWEAVKGTVKFADANAMTTTFIMPTENVEVKATYVHVHKSTVVTGQDATCTKAGTKTYYTCICGKYFEDAACTKEITADIAAWKVIPKKEHNYGKDNICIDCGAKKHIHKGTLVKGKKTTLKADGSRAYYTCACGLKFEDAKCTKEITGNINTWKKIARPKTITLSSKRYTYNGKIKKPGVQVTDSNGKKVSASNYKVTYAKGRKNIGAYKVTVTFKGNYSGKKVLTFKINPKKATLKSVKAAKKSFVVKWSKLSKKMPKKRITGYEVQYSASDKFVKGKTKLKKVSGYKKTGVKVTKLKAKKTYYVRVRTYMKVSGKYYYSDWSKVKKVKTKK